ncbi:DUF805 domain-containing protein [Henriciella sp. AS95]|uniref:DUF805 domain-containing protein n=1 Tax=Henriciella sp. AS95 TaxID=3135782 RepID=UPI00317FB1E2
MNWMHTLFDPTGKSPRLHFTRAWTLLFMLQLVVILVPFAAAMVVNMAGGNGAPIGAFGVYATPVVFIVTTLMSYVIHARRLNDAGKWTILAFLPLVPLVLALVAFMGTAMGEIQKYDQRFEQRQEYLANPEAYLERQLEQSRKAQEAAKQRAADAEASGEEPKAQPRGQQNRRAGGPGMAVDKPLPAKAPTVLKASLPTIQRIMIPLSALVAIWSLLWVARVPFFGTYPGDPDYRERRGYEV